MADLMPEYAIGVFLMLSSKVMLEPSRPTCGLYKSWIESLLAEAMLRSVLL